MASRLEQYEREQRAEATAALDLLLDSLAAATVKLPSAAVQRSSPFTGVTLVELGAARAEVIARLATVVRAGVEHLSFKGEL